MATINVTAGSSSTQIQTAINSANPGDTVVLLNGSYTLNGTITCSKAIKIMGQTIGGVNITDTTVGILWQFTPVSSGQQEFCNMNITASGTNTSSYIVFINFVNSPATTKPIAIHDCVFSGNANLNSIMHFEQNGGVVWNCTFNGGNTGTDITSTLIGIQFKCPGTDRWASPDTMGAGLATPDPATGNIGDQNGTFNTYVEDCTFNGFYTAATDTDDGSRAVIRHNTFNTSTCASHGYDTSPLGVRHWELYNNHFFYPFATNSASAPNVNSWIIMRGGTGVVTANIFQPQASQNWGSGRSSITWLSDGVTQVRCYTTYPIPRNVGQGWKSSGGGTYTESQPFGSGWSTLNGYFTDPVYAWSNSTDNTVQTGSANTQSWINNTGCNNGLTSQQFIVANQDFFFSTGATAAKPNWTPFAYPHPLRAQIAGLPNNSYTTTFPAPPAPENPISENGVWINAAAQGTSWFNCRTPSAALVCGTMVGNESGNAQFADSTAVLLGTWASEQTAQATIKVLTTPNQQAECEIRLRTTINSISNLITGYEINYSVSSQSGYVQIVRWNGTLGSFTILDSRNVAVAVTGNILKATIVTSGTSAIISAFISPNSLTTPLFTVTDTSPFTNGSPGVGFYLHNQTGVSANFGFSDFTASATSPGGSPTPVNATIHIL